MTKPDITSLRQKFWPFTTSQGFTIRPCTADELRAFQKDHFAEIFPTRDGSVPFPTTAEIANRIRPMIDLCYGNHIEYFMMFDANGTPVGWHMGEAEDAITYYLRNTGFLPRVQNQGLYTSFAEHIEKYLTAIGYERLTSQHQSTNRRILIRKLKDDFDIAGVELTERWGPLIKLVKLLPRDRREAYARAYGSLEHIKTRP